MKIAVVVSDVSHLVNAGGEVHRTFASFEVPKDMADYITRQRKFGSYTSISLAIEDETKEAGHGDYA